MEAIKRQLLVLGDCAIHIFNIKHVHVDSLKTKYILGDNSLNNMNDVNGDAIFSMSGYCEIGKTSRG